MEKSDDRHFTRLRARAERPHRRAAQECHEVTSSHALPVRQSLPSAALCVTAKLPSHMADIKAKFLFTIALEVEVSNLGDTPYGSRRIARD
jgi:hypothetical protein